MIIQIAQFIGAVIGLAAFLIGVRVACDYLTGQTKLRATQRRLAETKRLRIVTEDVVDCFAQKYPDAHWSIWLDRAVDKIIEITGVGREPATRSARAMIYGVRHSAVYNITSDVKPSAKESPNANKN